MVQIIRRYIYLFMLSYFLIVLVGILNYPNINENVLLFNVVFAIGYFLVIFLAINSPYYNLSRLIRIIVVFNVVFTTALLLFFYFNTGHFFSFAAVDSVYYQDIAERFHGSSLPATVKGILRENDLDDLGFPLFLSLIYSVVNKIVVARLAMVLIVSLSAFYTYKIGVSFLQKKFAFIATLLFYVSPAVILYSSNGLKENLMLLIINAAFYYFIKYQKLQKIKYLIYSIVVGSVIVLFRIPYIFFIVVSIGFTLLLYKKKSRISTYLYSLVLIGIVVYIIYFNYQYGIDRFTRINSDNVIDNIAQATGQNSFFAFLTSIFITVFGPLPSFFADPSKLDLTIVAITPYLKVLFTPLFLVGIYYIIRLKNAYGMPFVIFILINLISLVSIASSFEFRFHLMNFPFIFLISFYGLQHASRKVSRICFFSAFLLIAPVLIWNFGRL